MGKSFGRERGGCGSRDNGDTEQGDEEERQEGLDLLPFILERVDGGERDCFSKKLSGSMDIPAAFLGGGLL